MQRIFFSSKKEAAVANKPFIVFFKGLDHESNAKDNINSKDLKEYMFGDSEEDRDRFVAY